MWHLTNLALRSRTATVIIALVVAGASVWALTGLKTELLPNIDFPYATIVTVYPQATPDTVASQVTSPIEQVVWERWSGKGLKHITSTSSSGMSLIMAEFEFGADMPAVIRSIEEDIGKLTLPDAVIEFPKMTGTTGRNPQIIPINLSIMPLVTISVSGDLTTEELKQLASTQIVPRLEKTAGVVRVSLDGGSKDQVIITPDPVKMNQYGVSIAQITALLSANYTSLSGVEATSLGTGNVKLGDLAGVSKGPPPLSAIARTNGKPSIGISVSKEEKANTVEVANAVAAAIRDLSGKMDSGIQITTVFDQSDFIKSSVNQLWEKAVIGGALAIMIVFLFLWAVRASLITAISIPLSVLIGFLGMRLAGITINILTLSAMSIAVGRLIDDSIVMVEVIFRRRQRGESFKDAAIGGAREVANPITTATLATVAIFAPLMFVGGIVGEMFVPFALTVTFAMLGSLLVAITLVPALSRLLMSNKQRKTVVIDNWYQKIYTRALRWSLGHRAAVLSVSIALFLGSMGLMPLIGTSFMSGMSEKSMTVEIRMPPQTGLTATSDTAATVEALLARNKSVKSFYTTIGSSGTLAGMMSGSQNGGANTATISVYLMPGADLSRETKLMSEATAAIPGAVISVSNSESGGGGMSFSNSTTSLSVQGKDMVAVGKVTEQLMEQLRGVAGLTDIAADLTAVVPRLTIAIDPARVAASGLPPQQMAQLQQEFVLLMVGGTVPGKTLQTENDSYALFIQGITGGLNSLEQARGLKIGYPRSTTLGEVANVSIQELPSHISHTDTSLSATITATVTEKNVGAVTKAIQKQIDALPSHPGVEVKTAGLAEQMRESFSQMAMAILIAIAIVFVIVILMMRSIRNPLMIMASLPLAAIGAFVGLAISGYTLGISALMGILMLVGIVLTNAIVLVALVEDLRRKDGKTTQEALLEGGKTRLRPILMTALTTIFAMVPLAVGAGSGTLLSAELAVVVIGGLLSSTMLTLFVIPVLYSLVYRRREVATKT
jgi:HAE1 family hydrophobic/amphiphilic exporter-1